MASALNFFLPGAAGNLFAMYYPAASSSGDERNVLYVHPFAGEMLASKHMVATLARRLSSAGVGVLTVDLFGCGDSSGDFSEARWEIWREDLACAVRWLQDQGCARIGLWGLRLGALLAMDFAAHSDDAYDRILLWQPVVHGDRMMDQFFRMNFIPDRGTEETANKIASRDLRHSLSDGELVEADGYGVARELIVAIDRLSLAPLGTKISAPVHWLEIATRIEHLSDSPNPVVLEEWKRQGKRVKFSNAVAAPFWLFPYSAAARGLVDSLLSAFCNAGDE
jgi:exosortase A-associated hydrolase 2